MINDFSELKKILPEKGLDNVFNKLTGKSIEDIKDSLKALDIEVSDEVAKNCFDYLRGFEEIDDEEIENVTGGTCHSSDTYDELKIECEPDMGQVQSNHPVIVTSQNTCKFWKLNFGYSVKCELCSYERYHDGTWYCAIRSEENDPYK